MAKTKKPTLTESVKKIQEKQEIIEMKLNEISENQKKTNALKGTFGDVLQGATNVFSKWAEKPPQDKVKITRNEKENSIEISIDSKNTQLVKDILIEMNKKIDFNKIENNVALPPLANQHEKLTNKDFQDLKK